MKALLQIFSVGVCVFCLLGRAAGQDVVKVAPKECKVVLDNDRVRVIDVRLKPGDKLPMHSHPDYLAYAVTDAKIKFTTADGTAKEGEIKAGECKWRAAETHAVENIGKTEAHVLHVEFKK